MRLIWSPTQNRFVPPDAYWTEVAAGRKRSDTHPVPQLIRDGMESTMNHADGRRYDSKRAYEKAVHAAGCEIVGNDSSLVKAAPRRVEPAGVGEDIKRAWAEVESR